MTNYEKIKAMSIKEMAEFLGSTLSCEYGCDAQDLWYRNHFGKRCIQNCKLAISEWLESEAAE